MEIPRGRGILEAKILEAKYEAKLEFPRGGGGVQKKICGGSMDIFWNCRIYAFIDRAGEPDRKIFGLNSWHTNPAQ